MLLYNILKDYSSYAATDVNNTPDLLTEGILI